MTRAKIAAAATAAVLAGIGVAATATPASAAWGGCRSGALCAYVQPNGGGDPGEVFGDNSNLRQYTKFDNVESIWNNGNNCNVRLYEGLSRSGDSYVLSRGYATYDLYATRRDFYHDIDSNNWCV
ncbi:peptidase inhibitor family I36 protein [Streptomyces sp. MAR4 CNX-425]|uniref:peptidase inhibitor family I36 protein n=1 Tax=Streptomyces sp. MAR4 CNX-425 TaxID=3406343 RepID=UPI003B50A2E1